MDEITTQVTSLINAGMDLAAINAALGVRYGAVTEGVDADYEPDGTYAVQGAYAEKLAALAAEKGTAVAPAPVPADAATERQIAYALALAAKNAPGSLDLTADALRTKTRREVSAIIDSLKSEW